MARKKTGHAAPRAGHAGRRKLTMDEEWSLIVSGWADAFSTSEAERDAWFAHRDRMMRGFARQGRRPDAWWKHEVGEHPAEPQGDYSKLGLCLWPWPWDDESVRLAELGALADGEFALLAKISMERNQWVDAHSCKDPKTGEERRHQYSQDSVVAFLAEMKRTNKAEQARAIERWGTANWHNEHEGSQDPDVAH